MIQMRLHKEPHRVALVMGPHWAIALRTSYKGFDRLCLLDLADRSLPLHWLWLSP